MILLTPDQNEMVVDLEEFETVSKSFLINQTSEEREFRWIKTVNSAPDGWRVAICDLNACYTDVVDSMQLTLGPGDTSNIDVHVQPFEVEGQASVTVYIFDVANPAINATAEYTFNTESTTSVENLEHRNLIIYPNPVQDYFQLSHYDGVDELEIYNLALRKLKSEAVYQDRRFYINELNNGFYIVRLLKGGQEIKTVRLVKK